MSEEATPFRSRLSLLVPINNLQPRQQEQLLANGEILDVRKKEFVFRQGERDNWSYYLLAGELEMMAGDQLIKKVIGGEAASFQPLAQLQPRQMSARAVTGVQVLRVDRRLLDQLLSAARETPLEVAPAIEVTELSAVGTIDWLTALLQSELFSRIPAANAQRLLDTLEPVSFEAGAVVIEQGTPGDYYYVIQTGECEVCRATSRGRQVRLAELGPGDTFGEEALVSNATRNATVRMLSAATLGRLTKEHFIELISTPVLRSLSLAAAREAVAAGAVWLDVRFPEECQVNGIRGCVNLPLNLLRTRCGELDRGQRYVAYCDTGGRSSAAAFLLAQEGFDICYVESGAIDELGRGLPTPAAAAPVVETPVHPAVAAEVEAQSLATELARAQHQIAQARQLIAQAEAAKRDAERFVAARLASERSQMQRDAALLKTRITEALRFKELLEQQHRDAQAAAAAERAALEQRAQAFKADTERALHAKETQLEALYQQQASRLEQLELDRASAQRELDAARSKLELEATQSRERLLAAQRLETDLAAREAAAEAALAAREQALRAELRAEMEQERQRLEREFARSAAEIAEARQQQVAAEAGKRAAEAEAARIIEEYRARQQQEVAGMQETLRMERARLEAAAHAIEQRMAEALRTKAEAEAARDAALEQLADARGQVPRIDDGEQALRERIVAIEARATAAAQQLRAALEAQTDAARARDENAQDLARAYSSETALNQQLQQDLDDWVSEQAQTQATSERRRTELTRISERAAAAQQEATAPAFSLLDAIAAQRHD